MLVSPTLFGLSHDELELRDERHEAVTDEAGAAVGELGSSEEEVASRVGKVTYIDENDPFGVGNVDLMPVARLSSNSWVRQLQSY